MIKEKHKTILLLLILLGALLRILWLGYYPSGFFRDEAALGYNAYSIWQTGKDEYGLSYPLVFRSFEVFFLPAYVYLSAPIVGILGLTELSTRLLSSISGVASLFLVYLIGKEIWNKKVGLFSVLVLAISPWHIFYSRGAFEGNLALVLFAAGFLFWLKFLKRSKLPLFFLSIFFFAASMYSYQAERLVVPLFAFVAISLSLKKLSSMREKLIVPVIVIFILLIPILSLSFRAGGYHRAFGVSVFSQQERPPGWVEGREAGFLINNKVYLRGRQVVALYLSYFSPRNLFIEGDYDRQRSVENSSVFYAWMAPLLFLGIWQVAKRPSRKEKLLLFWMLLGPIPAALTGDPFHTYRALLTFMPFTIFIGLGLARAFDLVNFRLRILFVSALIIISSVSLLFFLFNYLVLTQAIRARAWDYGYKEIVPFIISLPKDTRVVVDDPWTEAYIHFLFFKKVDPSLYHNEVASRGPPEEYYYTNPDEIRPNKVGNVEFRPVDWPTERGDSGTVFVMWLERLPESEFMTDPKVELLKEVYYPDGKVAYRIVKIL